MKEIVEQFGMTFLHMAAVVLMVGIVFAMAMGDGIMHQAMSTYMGSICG